MTASYPQALASTDEAFASLALSWIKNPAAQLLGFVWLGYDNMKARPPSVIDGRDLERSITQILVPRIDDAMTGDEPFYVQHGPYEHETMKNPPAQPPQYDLAFVLRADERIMWPLEAKVLLTPQTVSDYVRDIREEFLTCRYAPFVNSGAMLGYLLSGPPSDAFDAISMALGCQLFPITEHPERENKLSDHLRIVSRTKRYPKEFRCFHLILEYHHLARARTKPP